MELQIRWSGFIKQKSPQKGTFYQGKNIKNDVLAVTNEKLHAWSASCDSAQRGRKQTGNDFSLLLLQNQIIHIKRCNFI